MRAFRDEPVAREDLEAVVACGQWAPSANNRQEWTFVVVDDRARIARLSAVVREALGRDAYDMYGPAAIVIVAHEKGAPFGREDDGCAMQSMMLAAHSLGLGSVWINQLQGICDEPAVRAELDALGVPATSEVHGVCALGHAAAEGTAHDRKSPRGVGVARRLPSRPGTGATAKPEGRTQRFLATPARFQRGRSGRGDEAGSMPRPNALPCQKTRGLAIGKRVSERACHGLPL